MHSFLYNFFIFTNYADISTHKNCYIKVIILLTYFNDYSWYYFVSYLLCNTLGLLN